MSAETRVTGEEDFKLRFVAKGSVKQKEGINDRAFIEKEVALTFDFEITSASEIRQLFDIHHTLGLSRTISNLEEIDEDEVVNRLIDDFDNIYAPKNWEVKIVGDVEAYRKMAQELMSTIQKQGVCKAENEVKALSALVNSGICCSSAEYALLDVAKEIDKDEQLIEDLYREDEE